MRVYISGKITGTNDFHKRFRKAERYLKKQGYEVINPVKISECLPICTHEEYMSVDMPALMLCEAIYMLKGWRYSLGARQEWKQAVLNGMKIMEE